MTTNLAAFVVLRSISTGHKFFTNNSPDSDPTKLKDGTLAYTILGYANTVKDAQIMLFGRSYV